jgi:hypothetical protein
MARSVVARQQSTLFGPLVFGHDRLPKREAESAPAWPSLATVQAQKDQEYRASMKRAKP